ncbi:MAG: fibronectin type III domain-containing protein [Planctomycetes bacterium]|nr:fibronectin type III domain-containing protein [Planctomycetota bacterium]
MPLLPGRKISKYSRTLILLLALLFGGGEPPAPAPPEPPEWNGANKQIIRYPKYITESKYIYDYFFNGIMAVCSVGDMSVESPSCIAIRGIKTTSAVFPESGLFYVDPRSQDQSNPVITIDETSGTYFILWNEYRNGSRKGIYGSKIDAEFNHVWPERSRELFYNDDHDSVINEIITIIDWYHFSADYFVIYTKKYFNGASDELMIAKIDQDGVVQSEEIVYNQGDEIIKVRAVDSGFDGLTAAIHIVFGGMNTGGSRSIYAGSFDAYNLTPFYTAREVFIGTGNEFNHEIIPFDRSVIIAAETDREGNIDICFQKLNSQGLPEFEPEGRLFDTVPNNDRTAPLIVRDYDNNLPGYIIVYNQDDNIKARRIRAGQPAWSPKDKLISIDGGINRNHSATSLVEPNSTRTCVVWESIIAGESESRIVCQAVINSSGDLFWDQEVQVSTGEKNKKSPIAFTTNMNDVIAAFKDYESDPAGILAGISAQIITGDTGLIFRPNAPDDLRLTYNPATNIATATWTNMNVSGDRGIIIQTSTDNRIYTVVAELGPTATSQELIPSDWGVNFYCKILVWLRINGVRSTAVSNTAFVAIPPRQPELNEPTIASTDPRISVRLSWHPNGTPQRVYLERKIDGGTYARIDNNQIPGTVIEFVDDDNNRGLQPAKTYYYRMQTLGTAGVPSPYSNEVSITTPDGGSPPPPAPTPSPLQSPTLLLARGISSSEILLEWDDRSNNEHGFEIWRNRENDNVFTRISVANANVETFTDRGLSSETVYSYKIRAFINGVAGPIFSEFSNIKAATTLAPTSSTPVPPVIIPDPSPAPTPNQNDQKGGKKRSKSGCYIATSSFDSHQQTLSAFRDKTLTQNINGSLSNNVYLKVSPLTAQIVSNHSFLKGINVSLFNSICSYLYLLGIFVIGLLFVVLSSGRFKS